LVAKQLRNASDNFGYAQVQDFDAFEFDGKPVFAFQGVDKWAIVSNGLLVTLPCKLGRIEASLEYTDYAQLLDSVLTWITFSSRQQMLVHRVINDDDVVFNS